MNCWIRRAVLSYTTLFAVNAIFLSGCAAPRAMPLTSAENHFGSSADEAKLIADSRRLHDDLVRKGMLLETETLTAYIERVGRPLVPDEASNVVDIHFNILRTPEVNAYAAPSGYVYLSVGLLARLENEAELAAVIGHEITHVVLRHSLSALETRRSNIIAAHITDLFLFGTSIAYFPFLASNAHYSRDQEQEADRYGMEAIIRNGYDPQEAIKVFVVMQEIKKGEEIEGSAYSSHPTNR
jgi:beta-barrel assembly-enhancing protease